MYKEQVENELLQYVNPKDNDVFQYYGVNKEEVGDFTRIIMDEKMIEIESSNNTIEALVNYKDIINDNTHDTKIDK